MDCPTADGSFGRNRSRLGGICLWCETCLWEAHESIHARDWYRNRLSSVALRSRNPAGSSHMQRLGGALRAVQAYGAARVQLDHSRNRPADLARTTLRNIIGTLTLKSANSERGKINSDLQGTMRNETNHWGIEIVR